MIGEVQSVIEVYYRTSLVTLLTSFSVSVPTRLRTIAWICPFDLLRMKPVLYSCLSLMLACSLPHFPVYRCIFFTQRIYGTILLNMNSFLAQTWYCQKESPETKIHSISANEKLINHFKINK